MSVSDHTYKNEISSILGDPIPFLRQLLQQLKADLMVVSDYPLDHICYRAGNQERYVALKTELLSIGELLSESLINGRPIASFKLNVPIQFENRVIDCLELPAPKPGSAYNEGYEHVEFVIDQDFDDFMARYPHLSFDQKARSKKINPDIRLSYQGFSVKFHHHSLEYVIRHLD